MVESDNGRRLLVPVASAVTADCNQRALLLLDEPFSGLDNAMRDDLLAELREYLQRSKTPVLLVTHDVGEAFQLGAEIIKIADGRVIQQGPAADGAGWRTRAFDGSAQRGEEKPSMTGSCSS